MADKTLKLNVCLVGQHNCGKSTIAGHLMSQRGAVDKSLIAKYEKEASDMGKGSFKYAWVTDKLKEERQTGTSTDTSVCRFDSSKYDVTIIDTPGHRRFLKNTIAGVAQADCVVLVVSAAQEKIETESSEMQEHVLLASTLGVKKVIVVVNKMDLTSPPYSQEKFKEIALKAAAVIKGCGFSPKATAFVPVSGWTGENLSEKSSKMSWFKGWNTEKKDGKDTGNSLMEAIDAIDVPSRDDLDAKPLRIPVSSVYNVKGIGIVAVGRVEAGTLKVGETVTFEPGRITAEVASIEVHHADIKSATTGDVVGFNVTSVLNGSVQKGMVCGDLQNNPPQPCESFIAKISVLNNSGVITVGYTPTIDCHTAHVPCKFVELISKLDKKGTEIEKAPSSLHSGDSALVKLVPMAPLCVDPTSENQAMGCFAVRDAKIVVGVGRVRSVVTVNPKKKIPKLNTVMSVFG